MAVVWHMDNLKVSHADRSEIIKLTGYLSNIYGGLTVYRGNLHDYLGMVPYYSNQGTAKVSMIK